jgi:hypothetical protein
LLEHAPNRGRGGDRRSARAKQQALEQSASALFVRGGARSHTSTVLFARLVQEKPEFYDAYQRGEYPSVTAAATAAGILKDNAQLRRTKSGYRGMTTEQRLEFLDWVIANTEEGELFLDRLFDETGGGPGPAPDDPGPKRPARKAAEKPRGRQRKGTNSCKTPRQ